MKIKFNKIGDFFFDCQENKLVWILVEVLLQNESSTTESWTSFFFCEHAHVYIVLIIGDKNKM